MNSKVGTDQAVGNTAWHADTGRERLQQGFHVIVCNVRPHLSLRLGTASILPLLGSFIAPARVQPSCLLPLLLLKTVSERGASARITITSKGVTCDTSRNLHIAVFFRLLSQSRVSIRVASSVAQIIKHPHEGFKFLLTNLPLGKRSSAFSYRRPWGTGLGFVLLRIQQD